MNIVKNRKHYLIYTFLIALISSLLWGYGGMFSLGIMMILCAIVLFISNDIKLALPFFINFIFVNGTVAATTNISIGTIVGAILLVAVILVYLGRNKVKLNIGKVGIVIGIMAVLFIVPLFYTKLIDYAHIFLYLCWLAYFLIYVFMNSVIKDDIKEEFSLAIEGLSILLSLECILSILRIAQTTKNFSDIYTLGWGICNEAGIMLLMLLPFTFYRLYMNFLKKECIYDVFVLILSIIGIFATLSRGTYMFALILIALLSIYFLWKKGYKRIVYLSLGILASLAFAVIIFKHEWFLSMAIDAIDNNGRFALYTKAIKAINKNPANLLFGAGMAFDIDIKNDVIVCHSTLYETLVCVGIIGLIVLIVHLYQKYTMLLKNRSIMNGMLLIGSIVIDIYGLIDNTYHMYYFMFILMLYLVVIEKSNNKGLSS